jgi:hypothetical protein
MSARFIARRPRVSAASNRKSFASFIRWAWEDNVEGLDQAGFDADRHSS